MNKSDLEARINQISKELEQALAVYHKLSGHLSEAKFMLDGLEKKDKETSVELDDYQSPMPCS